MVMRLVENFQPGEGYLAAASSFRHVLLVTMVATAVGAAAGAAVVLSLVNYSSSEPGSRSISTQSPASAALVSEVGPAAQGPAEQIAAPARAATTEGGIVAAAPAEARQRPAMHVERKAPQRGRVAVSRHKTRWWGFARVFAPPPTSRSW
jgi:hypothetical protein